MITSIGVQCSLYLQCKTQRLLELLQVKVHVDDARWLLILIQPVALLKCAINMVLRYQIPIALIMPLLSILLMYYFIDFTVKE